jgi:hypothetical protein
MECEARGRELESGEGLSSMLAAVDELVAWQVEGAVAPSTTCLGPLIPRDQLEHDSMRSVNLDYYGMVAHNGRLYTSSRDGWTPFVQVRGEAAKLLHFAHCRATGRTFAVCRRLQLRTPANLAQLQISHIWAFEELEEFFTCDVVDLAEHLYCVRDLLVYAPHHPFFHNGTPL